LTNVAFDCCRYFYPGLFVASVLAALGGAATIFTKDMRLEVGGVAINELHKYGLTALGTFFARSLQDASVAYSSCLTDSVSIFSLYWSESFQPLFVTVAIAGIRTPAIFTARLISQFSHWSPLPASRAGPRCGQGQG
jgi:hypothetical protein